MRSKFIFICFICLFQLDLSGQIIMNKARDSVFYVNRLDNIIRDDSDVYFLKKASFSLAGDTLFQNERVPLYLLYAMSPFPPSPPAREPHSLRYIDTISFPSIAHPAPLVLKREDSCAYIGWKHKNKKYSLQISNRYKQYQRGLVFEGYTLSIAADLGSTTIVTTEMGRYWNNIYPQREKRRVYAGLIYLCRNNDSLRVSFPPKIYIESIWKSEKLETVEDYWSEYEFKVEQINKQTGCTDFIAIIEERCLRMGKSFYETYLDSHHRVVPGEEGNPIRLSGRAVRIIGDTIKAKEYLDRNNINYTFTTQASAGIVPFESLIDQPYYYLKDLDECKIK